MSTAPEAVQKAVQDRIRVLVHENKTLVENERARAYKKEIKRQQLHEQLIDQQLRQHKEAERLQREQWNKLIAKRNRAFIDKENEAAIDRAQRMAELDMKEHEFRANEARFNEYVQQQRNELEAQRREVEAQKRQTRAPLASWSATSVGPPEAISTPMALQVQPGAASNPDIVDMQRKVDTIMEQVSSMREAVQLTQTVCEKANL